MSAVPKLRSGSPGLRLRRCRLDYNAALQEHLRGGCASRVARAAGSAATSRRNLRRVGLKIIAQLESRYDVLATFDLLGFTVEDFCRRVVAMMDATKVIRSYYRGRLVDEIRVPDFRAQAAAMWMYLKSTGLLRLPP